jgi:hypothetical protein
MTLAALPAQAALECQVYDDMIAAAVMVMQIKPTSIVPPQAAGQGNCTLTGEIVQSFLGPHPVGTVVQTSIPCTAPVADPDVEVPVVVGPTLWWDLDALQAAAVIELHIAPEGGPAGHGTGVVLLDAATSEPAWQSRCGG